jgi:hypothetical protein
MDLLPTFQISRLGRNKSIAFFTKILKMVATLRNIYEQTCGRI